MAEESKLPTVFRKKLPENLEKIRNGHYTPEDYDYPIYNYLKPNDLRVDENGSEVVEFLRGKNILVTGGTGFLGKLLIEKLLRCCKDIGTVYIIIRTKKGKSMEERINEFLDNWAFVKLSEIYPDYRKKLVGLSGDIAEPGLGLSEESKKLIMDRVNIIYHAAATVRFDEKLKTAVNINIKGTKEALELAKKCKKFDVFTYVGTAYSNCLENIIEEAVYEPYMDPDVLINLTDTLSEDILDKITPGILGNLPNTYTFTKQISESIVRKESSKIPICIHRPAIVVASVREPVKSWCDNIYGIVGMMIGISLGLIHVAPGAPHSPVDFVPADYVVNNCIAASYKTAKDRLSDAQIFNYTTHKGNRIKWINLYLANKQGWKVGSSYIIYRNFSAPIKNKCFHKSLQFLLHTLIGQAADVAAKLIGKKPKLGRIYKKINNGLQSVSFFSLGEFRFSYGNTTALWESLNEKDKTIFPFDMKTLDWEDYFSTYLVALRELLVHENLDNLDAGRKHYNRIRWIHNCLLSTLIGVSLYFCINTIFFFIPLGLICLTIFFGYYEFTYTNAL
ncbi:fatty acyl-CoA reductase wat-like isoform X1 [Sitophilus oryzae]|uniref:Fatty acyl-CoA reductase n=1 Tax=Sitophilus oryzae TaxID=7048 RepID=A0A6J2XYP3_SITOR|nr:fatty acyl-CoA reductase wat-like isoform X1 [Sitophilus oryzae]